MSAIVFEEVEKNYYLNLREFASGAFEAVLTTIKPMRSEFMASHIEGTNYSQDWSEKAGGPRGGVVVKRASEEISETARKNNHQRAVRRAEQNIRWLAKVLEADRLFTLTYRNTSYTDDPGYWHCRDRELVRADFKEFLRLVRKEMPDWKYVAVLEKTQRGAFHIHCAVKGWQRVEVLRRCWHKALGFAREYYGSQSPGNVDVTSPKEKKWGSVSRQWKTEKLAGYLTKYLGKTFDDATTEKRRYWHAKDLKTPIKQRIWIGGHNIVDAIKSTVATLQLAVGIQPDWDMWLSSSEDYFWIAGRGS